MKPIAVPSYRALPFTGCAPQAQRIPGERWKVRGHHFNGALVDGAMLPPMAVILSLEEVIAGIRHALDIRLGRSQLVTTSPCTIAKGSAPRTSGRAACCHSCQACWWIGH